MSKVIWKGSTQLAPVPSVLVTVGTMEKANAITIGWVGIINSQPPKAYISVRPERYSHHIIKESGEFVINLATREMVKSLDWCGVKSGRDNDKIAKCKLELEESIGVKAPKIAQSPLALECKVFDVIHLGSHDMFLADILNVVTDDKYLNSKGKLELGKAGLIAYVHGTYYELGKALGSFGFSVKKNGMKRR